MFESVWGFDETLGAIVGIDKRAAVSRTALGLTKPRGLWAAPSPSSPVALARCETYEISDVSKCLAAMMDQLGD